MKSILIVEDDLTLGMMLKTWLGKKGFEVSTESNMARAQKHLEEHVVELVLSDLRLPDRDGIHLLKWMNEKGLQTPLIMMTGYADIQSAVQAIKLGACDYIAKPVNPEELLKKIDEALQGKKETTSPTVPQTKRAINNHPHPSTESQNPSHLEGKSTVAQQLYHYVALVAPTTMSVLINGASGTGKEYVAQRIHQLSQRSHKPFIAIDCGSIPKELAASEFFGHTKGSFTGATSDKIGAFVAANGGTLFLDEVGNLSYEVQIQLLRALQERKVRPVGSTQEVTVDVRLVSATNENLELAIERGSFREDLYHRINEFTLRMPPLKERQEDILLFANFFLKQANQELNKQLVGFNEQATNMLLDYHWPGNLRQMKNLIKRATLLAENNLITPIELGNELAESQQMTQGLVLKKEESEKERIIEALRLSKNNKSKAAQLLDIDRKTIYNKLKLYGIEL